MHVLLLGAGFSRNWGGWLASEVIGELCGRLANEPDLVRLLMNKRNFEEVLAQLQQEARTGESDACDRLNRMEQAVREVFQDMNKAFVQCPGMEFSPHVQNSVQAYMANFDAIFTLNQDLLLEMYYKIELHRSPRRQWTGSYFPGVTPPPNWHSLRPEEHIHAQWTEAEHFKVESGTQPIFKLHGSVNWLDKEGGHLLVMGGSKESLIEHSKLLTWYQDKFSEYLFDGSTHLMVVGYSFSDIHINQILIDAAANNDMHMYLVNPQGLDVLNHQTVDKKQGQTTLADIPIVGVSTRPFRSAFEGDSLQLGSFRRFFT